MASDIRRSLVVAFASRELMAPDPGDKESLQLAFVVGRSKFCGYK
jgi:hypothetical protein